MSAQNYTNKLRFTASIKDTKAQLAGGVGNLTQGSIAGCGLNIQYNPIAYVPIIRCRKQCPNTAIIRRDLYIRTIAGINNAGYNQNNRPATSASVSFPYGVAVDSLGNIYIADTSNHVIRKVDAITNIITTVAGNGVRAYSGDGGPATSASLSFPEGVAVDSSGNIYIADTENHVIRKVDARGIITTVAGNRIPGFSGDGGPATGASLSNPRGVAVDSSGNIYIADSDNSVIRQLYYYP